MRKLGKTGLIAGLMMAGATPVWADGIGPFTASVPSAQPATGSPPDVVSSDFTQVVVAQGTDALENPSGVITNYGYLSTGVRTEPDENLYVELPNNPHGPTFGYNYGKHFLFQGHENGGGLAYVTRINLDVTDPAHRITLLTPVGAGGSTSFGSIDGSTYDAFTKTLLFSQEAGNTGGIIEISAGWPATVTTRYGLFGRGGFEGMKPDNNGNIYIVEDVGGSTLSTAGATKVKRPNSYIYRLVPYDKRNLDAGGKLQVLQVKVGGAPLCWSAVDADALGPEQLALHSGASSPTSWVTIHDTAVDGTASFNANALARAKCGTPFKRPENGTFKPDNTYRTFFFTITGDTDLAAGSNAAAAARGAWGGIFQLDLDSNQNLGSIKLFVLGDTTHNSFDNIMFGDSNTLLVAEDRGDTLHDQLNTLDSLWAYPLDGSPALRVVAQGRDVSATPAAGEDNEVTGVYVSDGGVSAGVGRALGRAEDLHNSRGFYTKQHGDNHTFEMIHN